MTLHTLAGLAGYLGALLCAAMVFPQLRRALRHRGSGGVSWLSWALTATGCLLWIAYGLEVGALPQVPGNLVLVPGAAAIALLVPSAVRRVHRAVALAAVAGTVAVAALALPGVLLGYAAFLVSVVSTVPQAVASVVGPRAGQRSSVSMSAWGMRAAGQVAWLLYADVQHDRPILIAAGVTLLAALTVLVAEQARHLHDNQAALTGLGAGGATPAGRGTLAG